MKMPKTREEFECAMLSAFRAGMNCGYGIDHTNIREEENNAIFEYVEENGFTTEAVKKALYR